MLEARDLFVSYGLHPAVSGVTVAVERGEIVVMLGANGAGKSTLLKAVAGLIARKAGGSVVLDGRDITGLAPHRILEAGIALVPEDRGIFGDLTVRENLALGAFARRARAEEARNLARLLELFPPLAARQGQVARTMSGGEQQMLAVGRALMSAPDFLLLDEPSLGLAPRLCKELFRTIRRIADAGLGLFLVEQNAAMGLTLADRVYILENGHIVREGTADALRSDPAVASAYLGV